MATAGYQLQKLTECSICLKAFTDPRILPCIHTFCLECLKQAYIAFANRPTWQGAQMADAAMKKPKGNMPCPLCRSIFTIPADGLDGLQKNFFVETTLEVKTTLQTSNPSAVACDICKHLYEEEENPPEATVCCVDCRKNFCDMCAKVHKLHKSSKDHNVVRIGSETEEDMRRISPKWNCTDHNGMQLDYYCPQCKKLVCVSCVVEKHVSHNCKDVVAVKEEFSQTIERNALKISLCAEEVLSKERNVDRRKNNILLKLVETEDEIRQRNLELKDLIDNHTKSLLDELSQIKEKQLKDCENDKKEIEHSHTVLKSFEAYCTELREKGSASDICCCVDEMVTRANELETDHELFIGRSSKSNDISFNATDFGEFPNTSNSNIVGRIQDSSQFENFVVIAGLNDGRNLTNDVFKISLHRPNDISTQQQIPTLIQNGAVAAVYCNIMYVTGIGVNYDEIWNYELASGWMKCASLVQGRSRHCAAFVGKVLYICGGFVKADDSVLDSVEGYSIVTDTCTTIGKLVNCVERSGNCVPYKSSLYIFGGKGKDNHAVSDVQVYNTVQNICTLLSKPMPRGYFWMSAALWDTSVVLVGYHTCFIFNFETEKWQERKQFKTDVVHFGLALENDRIYVIGGGMDETDKDGKTTWKCTDDIKYVPLQSIIDDIPLEWKICARLSKPVLVQTYGKIAIFCQRQ